ncbi:MAG: MaoC/PaaZ C-terminal domain-containing protein [Aeromicrobium sp.]
MTIPAAHAGTVSVGDPLPELVVTSVDVEHIMQMALVLHDPNPIHFDVASVRASGLGDVAINQGGSTAAYVLNLLAAWSGSRAHVRGIRCRFSANVFAGDDVTVGGTVTAVEPSADGDLVTCDVWARTPAGTNAVTGSARVLLPT